MAKKNQDVMEQEQEAVQSSDAAGFEEGGEAVGMIDFSDPNITDSGFEVLPRGIYDCIVDDVAYGISQRSNNPMWTWTFEVTTPEYANRKLFFHTVLTREQLGRTKKVLACVAPELLAVPLNPQQVADEGVLVGKPCRVRVDIRKYEGEDRNNVRAVMPPSGDAGGEESFLG